MPLKDLIVSSADQMWGAFYEGNGHLVAVGQNKVATMRLARQIMNKARDPCDAPYRLSDFDLRRVPRAV